MTLDERQEVTEKTTTEHTPIVQAGGIAAMFGVSGSRVGQFWRIEMVEREFPAPAGSLPTGLWWWTSEIVAWANKQKRKRQLTIPELWAHEDDLENWINRPRGPYPSEEKRKQRKKKPGTGPGS